MSKTQSIIKPLLDINDNLVEVGDIIYRSVYSTICKCQVVSISSTGIRVSVCRKDPRYTSRKWRYTIYKKGDFDQHNSTVTLRRYYYHGDDYPIVVLVEKRKLTAEDLQKYKEIPESSKIK